MRLMINDTINVGTWDRTALWSAVKSHGPERDGLVSLEADAHYPQYVSIIVSYFILFYVLWYLMAESSDDRALNADPLRNGGAAR